MYTLDTAAFYTDEEVALDRRLQKLRVISNKIHGREYKNNAIRKKHISKINELLRETKDTLKSVIDSNVGMIREVRPITLSEKNVISIFESNLTRALNMESDKVNMQMVVVRVYFFGVFQSLIENGFTIEKEKYVFFSASAGQIRTKRAVFCRQADLDKCWNTLTCGLSLDKINAMGGVNPNKYLAYLALCNSATDVWTDFNIDKTIVVDDFETLVTGTVDYIDDADYSITRKVMEVPVPHMDGCGMILYNRTDKNFMIRAPWVKGLLASFPFDKFIREANKREPSINHGIVTDVYGVQHDILEEGIEIIFTKSQVKMWKYYSSWEEYKENFKEYNCTAGICNVERGYIPNAKFNYQMLQTLCDLSDEELEEICKSTNAKLKSIASDRDTMLDVFGATKNNSDKNAFQQCLELYPELLQDPYCRETMRELKFKIEKEGRAGKFDIKGKYLFLVPDLYAFCEWLFLGIENPKGLLDDGEVYTRVFPNCDKLDCLRSPHLYREHAVRWNMCGRDEEYRRWFKTNGLYTSTHDLISKILMFDRPKCRTLWKHRDIKLGEPVIAGCGR